MMLRGKARPLLHPFARSRVNPVRRSVPPLGKLRLLVDEYLSWRLLGLPPPPGAAMRSLLPEMLSQLAQLDDAALDLRLAGTRPRAEEMLEPAGAMAFAEALEVLRRHTGFTLRDSQLSCCLGLLGGECIELRTGEGKTLAAGLAALVAARAGVSCHVVTVNDYLAGRDSALIAPMAARMGLRIAVVLQDMEDDARRAAYDADIVYGTNKIFVFDHLRDKREAGRPGAVPRQLGQAFAICDEADSVLVDDATVPMILSEMSGDLPESDVALFQSLDAFAQAQQPGQGRGRDAQGAWRLTNLGLVALERAAAGWRHPLARSEDIVQLAEKALAARWQFLPGEAYVRREDRIEMIDQSTGRLMPDRRWEYGLQQLVELAAGVLLSGESRTVAQVTQQTYFRQYRQLSGLTGTARECRPELWAIYGLRVRHVLPHAPMRLQDHGLRVFKDSRARWDFVAREAIRMAQERAVLIGVNDVSETHDLAEILRDLGADPAVLDALSEQEEAGLVAEGGKRGRITVATHLAGRGTDIALAPEVRAAGGLHVIIASAMASVRLERQFYGRAGRAGDPGSYQRVIWTGDRALSDGAQPILRRMMRFFLNFPGPQAWFLARLQGARDQRARVMRRKSLLREQKLVREMGYK